MRVVSKGRLVLFLQKLRVRDKEGAIEAVLTVAEMERGETFAAELEGSDRRGMGENQDRSAESP